MSEKFTLNWRKSCIKASASIRDALRAIADCGAMMACVVDDNGILTGILTDSDLRRALLSGGELDNPVTRWLNVNPVVASVGHSQSEVHKIVESFGVREVPVVDEEGRLQDIFALGTHELKISSEGRRGFPVEPFESINVPCAMMILAGGLGTRLRPLVADRPKSLAIVGNKPVLETLIMRAATQGIKKFYVSVNYMADQIEDHLKNDIYRGLDVRVIREEKRLGTAGSLSLIPDQLDAPLIVANSDILTTASLSRLVRLHQSRQAFMTCAVRPYSYKIPFGVCDVKDMQIARIAEKPDATVLVNAGLYVLSPEAVAQVPRDQLFDMPELVGVAIDSGKTVAPFYLHEYWIDIGRPEDFVRANDEFHLHFSVD